MFIRTERRRARIIGVSAFCLLLAFIAYVWAGAVTAAAGGASISADTAATGGTGAWTTLTGPTYAETVNGDVGNGTVTLTVPAGFEFNTASLVSVILLTGDSNAPRNMNNVAVGGNVAGVAGSNFSQTSTTITYTIFSKSQGSTLNTIRWQGIQVRPLSGTPLAAGNIVPSGTSLIANVTASNNFGTLTEVPGAMTKLVTVLPGQTFTPGTGITGSATAQTAGTAFNLSKLVATDKFNNPITTYSGSKTISYSGPTSGCATAPSYTTSVSFTNGQSTTTLATTLIKAETTAITASDGTVTGPASSSLLVNLAPINKLVVTLPGQTFTACFGNSGTASNQSADVAFTIPSITATDLYFNPITSYSGAKTLSYSGPTGSATYTTAVNFTNGVSTTSLSTNIVNAQTTTISVSDGTTSGPASASFVVVPTVSSFNAFESATAAGAISGVLKTKIAGTGFAVDLVALTSTPAVSSGFTGTVAVVLVDGTSGAACNSLPLIQTLPNQVFTAGDNGRHTISAGSIIEPNVWKNGRLRISYPVAAPNIISCSSDNFAIRPSTLSVAASDLDMQTAGTTRTLNNTLLPPGGIFHKAGQPFTITATAKNSAAVTTSNYIGTPGVFQALTQCASGNAVCPASLGTLTPGTWSASAGVATTSTASYSDVGALAMIVEDRTFSDVDLADSTTAERYVVASSATVGRFVPDHYVVTPVSLTPRTDIAACSGSSFSYMGEPFLLSYQLSAKNAAPTNGTTLNYSGLLATLDATNASHLNLGAVDSALPTRLVSAISAITKASPGKVTTSTAHGLTTGASVYISGAAGMTSINNLTYTVTVVDANNFTIGVDTSAYGTYTSGGTASRLALITSTGSWAAGGVSVATSVKLLRTVSPDGPFANTSIGIAPQDADGITATGFNLDADVSGSIERVSLGSTALRFGRLTLQNAYGTELANLRIPTQTQYWFGSYFKTNSQDNCTSISSVSNVVLNNQLGGVTAGNMVNPGNITLGGAFASGVGSLVILKPSPTATGRGSVDVSVNLSAESKLYLQSNWFGTTYTQNPKVRAAFGVYKNGEVIIYQRELY